jgi:hypothetical protein
MVMPEMVAEVMLLSIQASLGLKISSSERLTIMMIST